MGIDVKKIDAGKVYEAYMEKKQDLELEKQEHAKTKTELELLQKKHIEYEKNDKEIKGLLIDLAQIICPAIIIGMNNGKSYSSKNMAQLIKNQYLQEKKQDKTTILELKKVVKEIKESLKNVKNRLVENEVQRQKEIDEYIEQDNLEKFGRNMSDEELENELNNFDSDDFNFDDFASDDDERVNATMSSLKKIQKDILIVLGKTGVSELKDLYNEFQEHQKETRGDTSCFQTFEYTHINYLIREDVGVIREDFARTFAFKHKIITLTDLGKEIYKRLTGKEAVLPIAEKIIKDHDNLMHGYSIIDVAEVLRTRNYKEISIDRRANTMPINTDRRAYIPDIIARNPVDNKQECFEIEYSKHEKNDFETKLDKANLLVKVLRIVVADRIKKEEIRKKVLIWKEKRSPKMTSAIDIYILTFDELRRKETGILVSRNMTDKELIDLLNSGVNTNELKRLDEEDRIAYDKANEDKPNYTINEETGEAIFNESEDNDADNEDDFDEDNSNDDDTNSDDNDEDDSNSNEDILSQINNIMNSDGKKGDD